MIIGDSTMEQSTVALRNVAIRGGCAGNIKHGNSDTLTHKSYGRYNRGSYWLQYVLQNTPDFVILSAGAHVYNWPGFQQVITSVGNITKNWPSDVVQIYNAANKPMPHVFWKTAQPGECRAEKKSKLPNGCFPYHSRKYNWAMFPEQDDRAIRHFLQHTEVGIIDMRMLYERPDAHVVANGDCLHLCMKTDALYSTFPRMVMHEFAMATMTSDDATRAAPQPPSPLAGGLNPHNHYFK